MDKQKKRKLSLQTRKFLNVLRKHSNSKAIRQAIQKFTSGADLDLIVSDFEAAPNEQLSLVDVASQFLDEKQIVFFSRLIKLHRYAEDLVASRAAADWLDDPKFKNAYEKGSSISSWGTDIRWRSYVLMRSARLATQVEGNFVECGVSRGGTATCVINYLGFEAFRNRKFFLFDTYHGIEESQKTPEEMKKGSIPEDYFPEVLEEVRNNFRDCDFAQIVPGIVPDTLSAYDGTKVAYLHIDMNVSLPEIAAFRYFWPLISPGGVVVFDDYGFPRHSEQQHALDKVAEEFNIEIIMLPTGQGLVWKG